MATSAPVLIYYDPKKPVTLSVDASSKGRGALFYQEEKPDAYASTALTLTQQIYAEINRERDFDYCIWYNQVLPVPVWKTSSCHIRPKTAGTYMF
jgi:hypothetical protein